MKSKKKLMPLSDPKSPAAVVTGQRVKKMPEWPVWGAVPMPMGGVMKLKSLSDPKSAPAAYKGGTE